MKFDSSESLASIAPALVKALSKMDNAKLNKENPHFKSKYADLSGIRESVVGHLSENGIAVMQVPTYNGDGLVLCTTFLHESGEWIQGTYPIALDKPQQMGSAVTYARRYSLSAMCGIAADEDDDGNAAQAGSEQPATKPNGKPRASREELLSLKAWADANGVPKETILDTARRMFDVPSAQALTSAQLAELKAQLEAEAA